MTPQPNLCAGLTTEKARAWRVGANAEASVELEHYPNLRASQAVASSRSSFNDA